ncbi:hypothetical protein [Erythrobacter rubeus]|uniref:Uncharacterized protein n=1 Tax=Erythrobacter rubeus TaxID=2760803 RepID=A0ABR8KPR1_9SPHN|nr:hypothetical protein [Erythrobacter rubeus]MBD2842702.1 hypothetical protein [Erythrobacter rubeus]
MADITARLIKPLDGDPIGAKRTFSQADFDRLERQGAVEKWSTKAASKPKNKAAQKPQNKSAD